MYENYEERDTTIHVRAKKSVKAMLKEMSDASSQNYGRRNLTSQADFVEFSVETYYKNWKRERREREAKRNG